jgi:hypothetical protein
LEVEDIRMKIRSQKKVSNAIWSYILVSGLHPLLWRLGKEVEMSGSQAVLNLVKVSPDNGEDPGFCPLLVKDLSTCHFSFHFYLFSYFEEGKPTFIVGWGPETGR